MLLLLPPSEGKTVPGVRGRRLELGELSFPGLTDARKQVLEALIETSGRDDALELLDVGASLAAEVERNTRLERAPTAPAHQVYSGVLYDALGWPTLPAGAKRRGANRVLIASALWGWVRPGDRIPAYRLSMDGRLAGLGPLAAHWREHATATLTELAQQQSHGVIVDCRSGPYVAAAPIPAELAARTVAVRVLREENGRRTVVSHMAKHTRGAITRRLLEQPADPRTPQRLAALLGADRRVELTENRNRPWTLDVIE